MVEMTIDSIRVSLMNYQRVVMLKEKTAERYLPIWIGPAEADAIAVKLQGVSVPRPLTHDLLSTVINALGATVNSVFVSELKNDTFFAKIIFNVDGGQIEVDSRPSDALALAVRVDVPIYADETVLEKASIYIDKENGKPVIQDGRSESKEMNKEVSEDELKKMSAFRQFIDSLESLEEFNKHNPKEGPLPPKPE